MATSLPHSQECPVVGAGLCQDVRLLLRLGLLWLLLKWIAWGRRRVLLVGIVAALRIAEWAGGALAWGAAG